MELIDIHCHLIPYVDDGAYDLDEAGELLEEEVRQGVRRICLTPHLRRGMFETTDEEIEKRFAQLQQLAAERQLPLWLYHSREYHADSLFRARLEEGRVRPLGEGDTLLVEFGYHFELAEMLSALQMVRLAGYRPLVAHVERYDAVQRDAALAQKLADAGAMLQLNAGSILGREGLRQKHLCARLIRQGLVRVVASDAHDLEQRKPELAACASHLERKYGRETAKRLLSVNPLGILTGSNANT